MRKKMSEDERFMKEAIRQAKKAYAMEETPIGCVLVHEGRLSPEGITNEIKRKIHWGMAEIIVINKASRVLGDWRLEECTMYVTLEPCPMCAGAIVQARIPKVVIGSMNPKAGCAGSVLNLLDMPGFNHRVEVERGILEEPCSRLMSDFFKELRLKRKKST